MQIGIVPRDLQQSIGFYRDEIGLAVIGAIPVIHGRILHLFDAGDGAVVKLLEQPADAPTPATHDAMPFQRCTGIRWITLDVDDIDAVVQRCAGRAMQMPVTELRPGLRVCIVEDPDANAVELVERREV